MKNLLDLEHKLNYYFNDRNLLKTALIHRSFGNENKNFKTTSNERLELLGDAVLDLIVAEYLYRKNKSATEGTLAKTKAMVVSEPVLAKISRKLGIGSYLFLSKGEEMTGGRHRDSILADSFEAILGAIYMDSNLEEARNFALANIEEHIEHLGENEEILDFKTLLQEYVQKEFKVIPEYKLISEQGPDHMKEYEVEVSIGEHRATAKAGSKKKAQHLSARELCRKLGVKFNDETL